MQHSENDTALKRILLKMARRTMAVRGQNPDDATIDPTEIDEKTVMVCARAKGYPLDKEPWQEKSLRSVPRDIHCSKCGEQVVMSHGLFEVYQKNPRPELVQCGNCAFDV